MLLQKCFVEGVFAAALSQVIEEEKADNLGRCTNFSKVAGDVFYAVRSACIGVSVVLPRDFKRRYLGNPDDPELEKEKELREKLRDKKLLYDIGFTAAMWRETYRQIMQEELIHIECTEKLMKIEDESHRNRQREHFYFTCGDNAQYYAEVFKKSYLELAEDWANLDDDEGDPLKERLTYEESAKEENAMHDCKCAFSIKEKIVRAGNSKIFNDWHQNCGVSMEDFLDGLRWLCDDPCNGGSNGNMMTRELGSKRGDPKLYRLRRAYYQNTNDFVGFYHEDTNLLWGKQDAATISVKDHI